MVHFLRLKVILIGLPLGGGTRKQSNIMAELVGNLLVAQSGGPTAVINASVAGVIQEAGKHEAIEEIYGGQDKAHEAAAEVTAMLEGNSMDRIFAYGLHEFLTEFIARNNKVTEALAESYNFY